jgi:hypothetical protein
MISNDSKVIFTVCNLAYLPKALALAESVMLHEQKKIKIYLFDKKIQCEFPTDIAEIIWIEDLSIENLYTYAFKYDITEFSTSLKPYISLELLKDYESVVFLDPDTFLFNSIESIWNTLYEESFILTPHFITPKEDSDVGMMRFGSFNLGFFAVSNEDESISFLNWWNERCLNLCYFETQFGLSTDQKWVSIAPCFFPKLYISFDLGNNVAFWNAHERKISKDENNNYLVNNEFKLNFFHFSSFDEENPELLSKRPFSDQNMKREDLLELSLIYLSVLKKYKLPITKTPYGFDYMSDGSYISPTLRKAYASVYESFPKDHNPFSDEIVKNFVKKNFLVESKKQYISRGFKDLEKNMNKLVFINKILKAILYIVGPNRFMNFSRLLVFLSSYRLNKELWKL